MKSVAIIGAGITGLTAAFRLQQKKIAVTVYEASDRTGGVIQSLRRDGYLAESGPNTLLETSPKVKDLVEDLDLTGRRLYSNPAADKRYLVRAGRLVEMPQSALGFIRTPLFSPKAKLRLLLEPFIAAAPPSREESVAEFVRRRLGHEFLDRAVEALVGGIYAGDVQKISVREGFPKLYALEQQYGSLLKGQMLGAKERKARAEVSKRDAKKFSFDEGLQVLPEALRAKLTNELRLQTPVHKLVRRDADWIVGAGRDALETVHSAVLYAGTAFGLDRIEFEGCHMPLSSLQEIYYPPVASVVLGFRRKDVAHPLDGFGMLIPRVEGFQILGTIFSSSLFPNRAPAGFVTLTSYLGGARSPSVAQQSPEELFEITRKDLRRLLGVTGEPTFQHCVAFHRAIPQYNLGYGDFKKRMHRAEMNAPGFFLAGHYRDGISVSDCIVSGQGAAERVLAHLARLPAQSPRAMSTPAPVPA